jgi:hypothetical protein
MLIPHRLTRPLLIVLVLALSVLPVLAEEAAAVTDENLPEGIALFIWIIGLGAILMTGMVLISRAGSRGSDEDGV